ncbi:MAG: porin [Gammaproteobacteria bacterium]|nr:porin [Gammaproteobacteria bacterium]
MNKKILAVAIASAMAAPLAMADEGNVTLYGQANASIESVDGDGTGTAGTRTNVSTNGSRFGVKGWESVGNGLKAIFLMESAVALDSGGTTTLFDGGRDGYVGLEGNFGKVALGFHGQPYKTSTNGLDIFGDTIADYSGVMNGNGTYDSGIGNAVIWFAPDVNGLSGHVQYGVDETAGSNADKWGAQANYSNGPWYATVAHASVKSATANSDTRASKIGGSYTFGGATTFALIYENLSADSAVATGVKEHNAWYAALSHNMGNNTFKLAYANAGDDNDVANTGAKQWSVGLSHHLSKRSQLYALYTQLDNESGASNKLGTTGSSGELTPGVGLDPRAWAVGMKHSF